MARYLVRKKNIQARIVAKHWEIAIQEKMQWPERHAVGVGSAERLVDTGGHVSEN